MVRWPSAPGEPIGVVEEVDGPRLRVRFDGDSEPKMFNARAGVVDRVELRGMVRRLSTGDFGVIAALTTEDPPRWQVHINGRALTVPESDLRPYVLDDPRSRTVEGRFGSARQFGLAVTARRYELEHLTNDLVSLGESRVDIKPHQVSVVHRVVSNYPHRFLLCDEVGLGKTIEAGMVLKELRARGAAARTLAIVPPNLVRQWQFELKSKFNEPFSIVNSDTVKFLRTTQSFEGNPFDAYDSVIVSSSWVSNPKWAKLVAETPWDMVIVDEAHHARVRRSGKKREETRLYKVVKELASPNAFSKRAALFLTATPMQLDSSELYSLVELLDPALFPTEQHFDDHRAAVPGLSSLVHDLLDGGFPLADEDPSMTVERIAEWLGRDEDDVAARLEAGPTAIAELCEDLSAQHLLSEILIRNRKKLVGGFMPRVAHRWEVTLSPEERGALDAVERYVRDGFARADRTNDAAIGFVMVIFQKLMASSIRALRTSLDRRRQRLQDSSRAPRLSKRMKQQLGEIEGRLEDDEFISALLDEIAVADGEEAAELEKLVALLDAVPTDSKADTFVARLQELSEQEPDDKVLLFTEFRETQEYLRERIAAIGWDVQMFHGQLKPDAKDAAVEAFRQSERSSILLSTEAGGEGRNFQFCHNLVNYDLPWNPMRVEQRIGRVDRIGQTKTVQVFNFWVKGTVEERVLDVLERRINVFEQTVGGLDPILGEAEKDLTRILQLGDEKRDEALKRFEEQMESKIAAARAAEEKLRDFIMETKSYAKDIVATITGQVSPIEPADQERFVRHILSDVNTFLRQQPDGTWEIMFHEPFLSDFPAHAKEQLRRRTVAMRPDVQPDSEHVEYFAFGHPVIDDLMARATSPSYAGSAAAFEIEESGLDTDRIGWLLVYELGVSGLREQRRLLPIWVEDGAIKPDLEFGRVLLERAGRFPNDRALTPADVPGAGVDDAIAVSEAVAYAELNALEAAVGEDSARRYEREMSKVLAYFDYREQAAQDRLDSSRQVVATLEASHDPDQRRILPVWRANAARDERLVQDLVNERAEQLAQLMHRSVAAGDLSVVAIARIEAFASGAA